MKKILIPAIACLMLMACGAKPVRVAILTGPHGYDKEAFVPFMNSLEGITWKEYKNPEAQQLFKPENADQYDVLVFYDMCPEISDSLKADLVNLVKGGKSVMALHHGMGTYPEWPEFAKIEGSKYFWNAPQVTEAGDTLGFSTYREGVEMNITVVDKTHFITQGMDEKFIITDEVYGKMWQSPDMHVLWKTDCAESSPNLLYTHQYGKGKVVGLVLAHGPGSFNNKNYKIAFNRSLLWLGQK